jgi:2-polyprenyl-3-methyl-5-hydroxy-6-metoxy-1,4-benzoquinol methylase
LKISHGLQEDGVVVGNLYDKYTSRNPVVRRVMQGFTSALSELVALAAPTDIHEVGCGEGHWTLTWGSQGIPARGSDFSQAVIDLARDNARSTGLDPAMFNVRSIYDLQIEQDSADLVVCCEVLEHLTDPQAGLAALARVTRRNVILSVPREPIWCAMNMARGAYLSSWGNTPGHIQHWSRTAFLDLVKEHFEVLEVRTPLPWTMVLCRRKAAS